MLLRKLNKNLVGKTGISWLVSLSLVGSSLAAGAAIGAPGVMQATSPCTYSLELQKSVSARKRYLVKLAAVVGEKLPQTASVDEMYGNIKPASYNVDDNGLDEDLTGFGSTAKAEPPDLDPFSHDCLTCHDGAGAVQVTIDWRNNPSHLLGLRRPGGSDHPIGMDYESYASTGRDYKQIGQLSNKMVFVNGRVGCLTCHDPLNQEKGHLVMSDRKSALCLTCHSR